MGSILAAKHAESTLSDFSYTATDRNGDKIQTVGKDILADRLNAVGDYDAC